MSHRKPRAIKTTLGTTLAVLGAVLVGCVSDAPAPLAPDATDAGSDEDAAANPAPPGCDAAADAKDAVACAVNSYALFVDGNSGTDLNPGTREEPLRSIGAALHKTGRARIYACPATYPEAVTVTRKVAIIGGFACGTWSYAGGRAVIAPRDAGVALTVTGVAGDVMLSDLQVSPASVSPKATSSIAIFVASSPRVTLRRVLATAGLAEQGADGAEAAPAALTGGGEYTGNNASGITGGITKICTCAGGGDTSTGGAGGSANGKGSGESGLPVQSPSTSPGRGQTSAECASGASSGSTLGSAAPPSVDAPFPVLGTVDAMGWHPGDGAAGPTGKPGQGGGGGGSNNAAGTSLNGGGGGACGGCGGGGGGGGHGGGASIGLLTLDAPVAIEASTI
ncbi:MAG: Glycine-rich cell wall structural protein precursor, partial [Labilithrix sp.]|nr:Glycine-rich cell wall structural protein precursor [Labilithrix sp.]